MLALNSHIYACLCLLRPGMEGLGHQVYLGCVRVCVHVSMFCGLNLLVIISKLPMFLSVELRKRYFLLVPFNKERAQIRLLHLTSRVLHASIFCLSVCLNPCLPVLKPAAAVSDFYPSVTSSPAFVAVSFLIYLLIQFFFSHSEACLRIHP